MVGEVLAEIKVWLKVTHFYHSLGKYSSYGNICAKNSLCQMVNKTGVVSLGGFASDTSILLEKYAPFRGKLSCLSDYGIFG
jgi:hypothetical protein